MDGIFSLFLSCSSVVIDYWDKQRFLDQPSHLGREGGVDIRGGQGRHQRCLQISILSFVPASVSQTARQEEEGKTNSPPIPCLCPLQGR